MIFVISYDRKTRTSTWLGTFDDKEMSSAQQLRLETETGTRLLNPQPEIVVLSAESEEALVKTHSRYLGSEGFLRDLKREATSSEVSLET